MERNNGAFYPKSEAFRWIWAKVKKRRRHKPCGLSADSFFELDFAARCKAALGEQIFSKASFESEAIVSIASEKTKNLGKFAL